MKKKKVIIGWTFRDESFDIKNPINECMPYKFPEIFSRRGNKYTWDTKDWPPIKVKVTFEWRK